MNGSLLSLFVASSLLASVAAACSSSSSSPPSGDTNGACAAVASACHPYDKESAIGHECHELGHEGDDAKCAVRRAECLAACPPKPEEDAGGADAVSEAAPGDASADAGDGSTADPACTALCRCLGTTCSGVAGYPFADEAACLSKCASLGAEEKACFPKWCAKAESASGSSATHFCEHAWGKLGTNECDTL